MWQTQGGLIMCNRKFRLLFLISICLILIVGGTSFAFFEEDRISVKMSGMGNLFTENDIAGGLFYPAVLPTTRPGFELMHSQGYTPSSSIDFGGFVTGFGMFGFGAGFNRLQEKDLDFAETTIWLTMGATITPTFSIGLGGKYFAVSTPVTAKQQTFTLEPTFQLTKDAYVLRIKANNLLVGQSELKESISKYSEITLLYRGKGFNVAAGYSGLEKFSIGYEQLLNENFQLRAGYESDGVISLGTTISVGRLAVNLALINDDVTGFQQRVSLAF